MLTTQQVQNFIALQQNNNLISVTDIKNILNFAHGTTFAQIVQVTPVTTAAKFKNVKISKVSIANVQLFNNLTGFTDVYENAVKRSASKLGISAITNIQNFETCDNWFEHTDCFSIVKHKTQNKFYLFAIYNSVSETEFMIDGKIVSKQEVSAYLTPAASRELLSPASATHNVTNDVTHAVVVRTIALCNIVSITAMKQNITV